VRSDEGLVRIEFKLRPATRGGLRGETLWAEPVGVGRVRLRNTPFYVVGVSAEDVVFARLERGRLVYKGVSLRGGHSTYRIVLEGEEQRARFDSRWAAFRKLGCTFEGDGRGTFAVDVPPHADADEIVDLLEAGASAGVWWYEEAHREHPHQGGVSSRKSAESPCSGGEGRNEEPPATQVVTGGMMEREKGFDRGNLT
jgi:hypothetical protein